MIEEYTSTNLFHANSVNTDDNSYSKRELIKNVYALKDYSNYIRKSIEVIQKDGAIKIPLKKGEIRYYIQSYNPLTKDQEIVINQIFTNKISKVFINDSKIEVQIIRQNSTENFIVLKTNKEVNRITIELKTKNISINLEAATLHYLETDQLKDRAAKKVETELFEKDTHYVYTEKPSANHNENRANELYIKTRNATERFIVLDTSEKIDFIYLKANDYQLQMQKKAIETLMKKPLAEHTPLQKLFDLSYKSKSYFEKNIEFLPKPTFKILNKPNEFDGTKEQQNFVVKALQTKDFALLEGPPGSGKTTAIIELIIQLIKQKKRVLLVSATHVAVDNVIHRMLTTFKDQCEGLVVPIRIASDIGSIRKESVEPYELKSFVKKTKEEIKKNLRRRKIKKSGKILIESIMSNSKDSDNVKEEQATINDLILNSANLVGGTMIGILQHPGIKKGGIQEMFDVMIVDESSKVTFLDFIVPALYAKKWVLVGDVNQLSPYTEDDFINENIDNALKNKEEKEKLVKSFELKRKLSSNNHWDKESLKILFSNNHTKYDFPEYEVYKISQNFEPTQNNILKLNSVDIVICKSTKEHRKIIADTVFVKSLLFEGEIEQTHFKNRQKSYHKNKGKRRNIPFHKYEFTRNQEWKEMLGNILSQMYQYRFDKNSTQDLKNEYDLLVPDNIQNDIEKIRRVALPSILELLQIGVGEKSKTTKDGEKQTEKKLIYEGFNMFEEIKGNKFQSLSYQHRMEDEIASIPREHFYKGKNLETANTVAKRNNTIEWYKPNEAKVIWMSNKDTTSEQRNGEKIVNPTEIQHIKLELEAFIKQAKAIPKKDNEKYEIAALTFYNAQELELKKMLRTLTNQPKEHKFFIKNNVEITLSTVDKFQGDEADMVLLSFTKFTRKAFYNSPNRLNVALTRARHKLILYGNKEWLSKNAQLKALREIAIEKDSRLTR